MAGVEEIEGNIHHCFTRSYLHQGGVEPYDTDILPTAGGQADGQQQGDTSAHSSERDLSGREDTSQDHSAAGSEMGESLQSRFDPAFDAAVHASQCRGAVRHIVDLQNSWSELT